MEWLWVLGFSGYACAASDFWGLQESETQESINGSLLSVSAAYIGPDHQNI